MLEEHWVHLQWAPVATLNSYITLEHWSIMEMVGCLWKCKLHKLQVRLVLLRGKRAVRAEPEQGTGLGVGEELGVRLCQEWSLVNLWMLDRQTLCTCNPLFLAFSQQGSGRTNNRKSKLKKKLLCSSKCSTKEKNILPYCIYRKYLNISFKESKINTETATDVTVSSSLQHPPFPCSCFKEMMTRSCFHLLQPQPLSQLFWIQKFDQDVGTAELQQQSDMSMSSEVTGSPQGRQELTASTTGCEGAAVTYRKHPCVARPNK